MCQCTEAPIFMKTTVRGRLRFRSGPVFQVEVAMAFAESDIIACSAFQSPSEDNCRPPPPDVRETKDEHVGVLLRPHSQKPSLLV